MFVKDINVRSRKVGEVGMIWFRFAKDGRDIPVYYRKAYKKARHKRKSERLSPGYWDAFVKGEYSEDEKL